MSEDMYQMDVSESALMESMKQRRGSGSNRLIESARSKMEKEKAVLRNIKVKRGLATDTLNEDANPPIHEFVKLVKQGPQGGEPSGLMWRPSSIENILAMYPQQNAISDINSAISAANQQSGVPVALVGPGDNRGETFIKTDAQGNFYVAQGDKNPAAYVNPAASSYNAGSVPTTSSFEKPQINTGDVRHIIASMAEDIKSLRDEVRLLKEAKTASAPVAITETEEDPLSMDNLLVEKMNIQKQMEGLDDKSKSVIQKLLNAAQAIRNGEAALLDDVATPPKTANSSTNMSLTEDANYAPKAPEISLNSLHAMLLKTTVALGNNRSNVRLEHLADNISTLIAEGLMNDRINSVGLMQETFTAYKELVK